MTVLPLHSGLALHDGFSHGESRQSPCQYRPLQIPNHSIMKSSKDGGWDISENPKVLKWELVFRMNCA